MLTFDAMMDRILGAEGGYVNDPRDPGGETNWGIAKRSHPTVDIKHLTKEQAVAIYRRDYWQAVEKLGLPDGLAFQVLDAAINHGMGNAVRWLQLALGVGADGVVGPVTVAAIRRDGAWDSIPTLIFRFNAERLDFYTQLSTWDRFGKGWARRIVNNLAYASVDL